MDIVSSRWDLILKAVTTPVILFGLIVLSVLGIGITVASQSVWTIEKLYAILSVLFVLLIVIVASFVLVWCKARDFTYSQAGHLLSDSMWGVPGKPKTSGEIMKASKPTRRGG